VKPSAYLVLGLDAREVNACREEQLPFVKDTPLLPVRQGDAPQSGFLLLLRGDDLCLSFNLLKAASELLVVEETCLPDDCRLVVVVLLPLALLYVLVSLVELLLGFHQKLRFR